MSVSVEEPTSPSGWHADGRVCIGGHASLGGVYTMATPSISLSERSSVMSLLRPVSASPGISPCNWLPASKRPLTSPDEHSTPDQVQGFLKNWRRVKRGKCGKDANIGRE